jgi:hypothetical protein
MTSVLGVDRTRAQVTVQAGIRLRELNERLAGWDGDAEPRRHRRAVGRGGHQHRHARHRPRSRQPRDHGGGDGARRPAPARSVRCSADVSPDLLRVARVGVGALGVVTAVTLQCVEAFRSPRGRDHRGARRRAGRLLRVRRQRRPRRAVLDAGGSPLPGQAQPSHRRAGSAPIHVGLRARQVDRGEPRLRRSCAVWVVGSRRSPRVWPSWSPPLPPSAT